MISKAIVKWSRLKAENIEKRYGEGRTVALIKISINEWDGEYNYRLPKKNHFKFIKTSFL